jgi:hypothetical protein
MTSHLDVAKGREIVARWCTLAERRLEYLTELFETGRWRRFHGEQAFLENIREAKTAVEAWRDLLSREALPDNRAIDLSWIGRARTMLPPTAFGSALPHRPQAPKVAADLLQKVSDVPEVDGVDVREMPFAETPREDTAVTVLDLTTIAIRYPLLRNAM